MLDAQDVGLAALSGRILTRLGAIANLPDGYFGDAARSAVLLCLSAAGGYGLWTGRVPAMLTAVTFIAAVLAPNATSTLFGLAVAVLLFPRASETMALRGGSSRRRSRRLPGKGRWPHPRPVVPASSSIM